ncbi:MAG TPA: gamma-glutamyltransferase family protein [Phycisphaerales bacterium]|nr:gamma-glutamyltransferase family protein [Phycisphaerales bacterium]HMP38208.1 gamma-glutamyltransferase family protein [Phycisphaerales bacterium]
MRIDWTLPYPSQREPLFARRAVATSQPLAAQAGLQMLLLGGSAADAAVATAAVLTVVEPTANGIGSDAFALVWAGGSLHGLNASGRSPRGLRIERFDELDAMPRLGWDAVTVPGCVSGWRALSERFGRLPFETCIEPAIRFAREGFLVSRQTALGWGRAEERFRDRAGLRFEEFRRVFLPAGRAPRPGELIALPDHGATLEAIAASGGESFYRGALAERIAAASAADGAHLTIEDLGSHRAEWVEPISIAYRGVRLHEIPPNGQGIAALQALGVLRHFEIDALQPDCPDVLHLQIEAMKLAFADAHAHVADPATMRIAPAALLDDAYLAARARAIDPVRAGDPGHGTPQYGGTVLLCAADADGMMVSFIQSNFEGFGSGVVIPGTGIALQNRGAGFTLARDHPNRVAAGKRPYHTIIPGFVTRDGGSSRPLMAFGVMGGAMQPQGHVQVLARLVDFAQNPQAALDAPRWQVGDGRVVELEPGLASATVEELAARGHAVRQADSRNVRFGGGQAILALDDGYVAASDLRRDGLAIGW